MRPIRRGVGVTFVLAFPRAALFAPGLTAKRAGLDQTLFSARTVFDFYFSPSLLRALLPFSRISLW
jgi:hypothetical protein